jgi:hypothetical protein
MITGTFATQEHMNKDTIKDNLKAAHALATEIYGENPAPEITAAVLNAIIAQSVNDTLETMTSDLCRAAAVAAGN